jgi:hypothetical protein
VIVERNEARSCLVGKSLSKKQNFPKKFIVVVQLCARIFANSQVLSSSKGKGLGFEVYSCFSVPKDAGGRHHHSQCSGVDGYGGGSVK